MKNNSYVIFTIILSLSVIFFSCKDNSTSPADNGNSKNYFPNSQGSNFVYDFEITDSLNNTVIVERNSTYNGSKTINSKSYQILIDHFTFPSYSITDSSYFRKLDTGVMFFADFSDAMTLVPDSLRSLVQADEEAKLLSFPLGVNQNWQAYKLGINFGAVVFNVIVVSARPEAIENISLTVNNAPFNKEALRIKYTMSVAVDMTSAPLTYTAYAWMVDEVGLVKLEGDTEAINFMVGGNMFLPGGYIKQTLKQYSIP